METSLLKVGAAIPLLFGLVGLSACGGNDFDGRDGSGSLLGEDDGCDVSDDCDWDQLCDFGTCEDIFGRSFDVVIESASASTGVEWDAFGGAPDLFVVVYSAGDKCATSTKDDNFYPYWNESCSMIIEDGGTLEVEMWDEDTSSHDIVLTYEARGNDELAEVIRWGDNVLSNSQAELSLTFRPDF